ncbi:MAG: ATP-binding cassette domain-containing protein, partial [Ancalomicrobiaceae bacterium]|nr:ATP-binding cassette domain-containing protein [Ancalomicrobiaceae bacterium]
MSREAVDAPTVGQGRIADRQGAAAAAHVRVPLLDVAGLTLEFETRSGRVKALEDIGFTLAKGEILGIVGESGSGKSVLSYAV